jgi:DNA modification methylase
VICLDHLSEQQIREFMLADNKLAEGSEWDLDVLRVELSELAVDLDYNFELIGFDDVEVDVILHGDDQTPEITESDSEDVLPALRKRPVTCAADLWQLGAGRLICGDARDALVYERLLGSERVQLVVTDSPYNVRVSDISGLGRHQHREFAMASGEMTPAEFTEFLSTVFTHLATYSVDGSLHYLFMDHRHMGEILTAGDAVYDSRLNLLVWEKTAGAMGSFYRSQHELIFLYKKGKKPHINNVQLGANGRYRTNVIEVAGANTFRAGRDEELARHPTSKPTKLIADLIRDASRLNDWVLDSFVGGGTVFIAAEQTHRRAAGCEIDPLYCDLTIERWQKFTGQSAILVATGQTFAEVAAERLNQSASDASGERS